MARYDMAESDEVVRALQQYCELLWDWNTRLNLTRHTDYESFVTRDLLDSSRLAGHIPEGNSVLDVGSGGGVPGIVITILRPDLAVTLIDSTAKKANALKEIVAVPGTGHSGCG